MSVAVVLAATGSAAQEIPESVDPGQIERRFERPPEPRAEPEAQFPEADQPLAPEDAEAVKLELTGIVLSGITVYQEAELIPLYEDLLGTQVSLFDVYGIRDAITAKYRGDGYILSQAVVPAQNIRNGVVEIRIVEGFIRDVAIEGETSDRGLIRRYLHNVTKSRPLHIDVLERYALLADDLPGVMVHTILRPSETPETGAAELVTVVRQDAWDGGVAIDNRGTESIGPYQIDLRVQANSLLGLHELTAIRAITTFQTRELRYGQVVHEQRIGSEGTVLQVTGRRTLSEPGAEIRRFEIESDSTSAEVQVRHPILRSRSENLYVLGGFAYRDSETRSFGGRLSEDRLRVATIGLIYDFADRLGGLNLINPVIRRGLDVFNASKAGSPDLSRADGRSDFTSLLLRISRAQPLVDRVSLLVAAAGQVTADELLAAEEFSVGGGAFGRAYDPSEITGDRGVAATIELQYLAPVESEAIGYLQLYGFYDIGAVWNFNGGPRAGRQSLASAGLGTRFGLAGFLTGSIELAKPLTRIVADEGDEDLRGFFTLSAEF